MRALGRLLLFVSLVALSWPAFPAELFRHPLPSAMPPALREIHQRFAQAEVLELRFRQQKWLPELQQPLVSTGTLTVAPNLGLEWRTDQPFPSVWRVTRDGHVLDGSENPASEAIAHLLLALLSADIKPLQSTFSLYWLQQPSHWLLGLQPHDPRLRHVLDSIVVSGAHSVQRVEVRERSGDRTQIDFISTRTGILTDTLRARFQTH